MRLGTHHVTAIGCCRFGVFDEAGAYIVWLFLHGAFNRRYALGLFVFFVIDQVQGLVFFCFLFVYFVCSVVFLFCRFSGLGG